MISAQQLSNQRTWDTAGVAAKCRCWRIRLFKCRLQQQQQHHQQQHLCGVNSNVAARCSSGTTWAGTVLGTVTEASAAAAVVGDAGTHSSRSSSALPSVGDLLEMRCERLGVGGIGVCLWGASKLVVMVEQALPGEVLTARITTVRKGHAEGEKVATHHPHDNAATPDCKHFGSCGGCSLQNLQYSAQLHHKTEHVAQLFTRVGKLNPTLVQATRLSPAAAAENRRYQYRNKIQLAFSTRIWQEGRKQQGLQEAMQQQQQGHAVGGWGLGFYLPGSNSVVVPVEQCSLVPPEFNAVIAAVRRLGQQQQQLQPYNPADGTGVLRHLIIRSASAAMTAESTAVAAATAEPSTAAAGANGMTCSASLGTAEPSTAGAAAAAAGNTTPPAAAATALMVVFVTTDSCDPVQLQPLCAALIRACPNVVSVVHSTEAGAAAATATAAAHDPLDQDEDQLHPVINIRQKMSAAAVTAIQERSQRGKDQQWGSKAAGKRSKLQQQQRRAARALAVSTTAVLAGVPHLVEELNGLHFHISPHSFFQTNTQQAEVLYQQVVDAVQDYYTQTVQGSATNSSAAAAAAPVSGSSSSGSSSSSKAVPRRQTGIVLDLYCGTGTITLSLASRLQQHCKQIIGFDVSVSSIADARANAARNNIHNVSFVCGDLTQLARGALVPGPNAGPDVVVVDPARAGLGSSVVEYLLRSGAQRVVYVSCNAATQARDLQLLCGTNTSSSSSSGTTVGNQQQRPWQKGRSAAGARQCSSSSTSGLHVAYFKVASWRGVDMFPHTDHLETVVVLDRV